MGQPLRCLRFRQGNSQIAARGSIAVKLILAFGILWLSMRGCLVPYVVQVDKLGFALTAPQALSARAKTGAATMLKRWKQSPFSVT
jgi:type IV secretory pathway TrbF-like protein